LVGGLAEPLRFGSTAGALSGSGHATAGQIALGTLQEAGRAAAIIPVGAAIGKGTGALVSSLTADSEEEVVGDAASLLRSGSCFAAGTLVQTPDGLVPIEQIKEGDSVFAYDFSENRVVERKVLATINHITDYWVLVGINGEQLKATRSHLFWVESVNAWVSALNLKPGMTIRCSDGRVLPIESVKLIELSESEDTYNLVVDTDHDYFVGQNGTLVHNGDHGNDASDTRTQHRYVIKDNDVTMPGGDSDVVKTGIANDNRLNQNGTSGRANQQVNKLNNAEGRDRYSAEIKDKSIPGRQSALDVERKAAADLKAQGNSMRLHQRPKC
jgi:hypothetical protein